VPYDPKNTVYTTFLYFQKEIQIVPPKPILTLVKYMLL